MWRSATPHFHWSIRHCYPWFGSYMGLTIIWYPCRMIWLREWPKGRRMDRAQSTTSCCVPANVHVSGILLNLEVEPRTCLHLPLQISATARAYGRIDRCLMTSRVPQWRQAASCLRHTKWFCSYGRVTWSSWHVARNRRPNESKVGPPCNESKAGRELVSLAPVSSRC